MMRSLYSAVSGLRNHQTRMDVIGNNIANSNTVGFKASRVTFKEGFSQLIRNSSSPPQGASGSVGGTNPVQVGLGMSVGSIDQLFTQGSLESTGIVTDLSIQGSSYFAVSDGQQNFYTRAGNFAVDGDGRLAMTSNGLVVQGRLASGGVLADAVGDIRLPLGQTAPAQATSEVLFGGNLDASAAIGTERVTSTTVTDTQGGAHELSVVFTKTGVNTWDYAVSVGDGAITTGDAGTITFDDDGALVDPASSDLSFTPDGFGADQSITIGWGTAGDIDGLSQFASAVTAVIRDQNGFPMGELDRISIDQTGLIKGSFTNGEILTLGQVGLADFNNPGGVARASDNLYTASANSGEAVIGFASEGSQSRINSGSLEMSNVDLAQEFTNMIMTQRGFQSNARVISTSDEMLQELVNLRR